MKEMIGIVELYFLFVYKLSESDDPYDWYDDMIANCFNFN